MMRASGVDKGRTDDRNVDFPQSGSPSNNMDISRGSSILNYVSFTFSLTMMRETEDGRQ